MKTRAILWPAVAAFSVGFAALSIGQQRAFNTGRFDLGNMTQAVWATAHGHFLEVTNLAGEQTSRLGSHFDPILAALAPLWLLWPSPDMLMAVQALAVALGALPVFWLARKHLDSEHAALGFALAYLLYPATEWLTLNEFHPVAFATPLLLYAFWFLDEDRLWPFAVFAALAICCKEEIGLVVAGFGIWYVVSRKRWRAGGAVVAAGVAASAIAVEVVVPHFSGSTSAFYSRYSEVGGTPGGIVRTLFTHPGTVLGQAFSRGDLDYLGHMLVPLGFLWVLSPVLLLAALPEAALNVLSKNPYQASVHFHYVAGLIPPLVIASVFGAARLARRRPRAKRLIGPGVLVLAVLSNFWIGALPIWAKLPGGDDYQQHATRVTAHDRITQRAVDLVPGGVVVSATNSLGAHLSARRRILSFPRLDDATWVAVDETNGSYLDGTGPLPMEADVVLLRSDPAWELVFEQDGVLVFRRVSGYPTGRSAAAQSPSGSYRSSSSSAAGTTARS
ncbi:MAG TPA: DUF2079 domain-containing protein [Gaiellaceae bacterium]|nr:DUF2079 domain-containing protein [Gaiellaceae bacterium]